MHCFRRCHFFFLRWKLVYLKWYRTWTCLLLNLGNGVIFEILFVQYDLQEGRVEIPHFSWWYFSMGKPLHLEGGVRLLLVVVVVVLPPLFIWRKRWKVSLVFWVNFLGKASETSTYRSPLSSFQLWRRNTKDSNQSSVYFGRQSGEWDIGNRAKRKLQLDKNVGGRRDDRRSYVSFMWKWHEVAILDAFVLDLDTCWCGNRWCFLIFLALCPGINQSFNHWRKVRSILLRNGLGRWLEHEHLQNYYH